MSHKKPFFCKDSTARWYIVISSSSKCFINGMAFFHLEKCMMGYDLQPITKKKYGQLNSPGGLVNTDVSKTFQPPTYPVKNIRCFHLRY